jgi:hypothetical protein
LGCSRPGECINFARLSNFRSLPAKPELYLKEIKTFVYIMST